MALKKIGAIIALDGEKEFKQNTTSCNKALSELKSEMQLVKAQCEGQENSLEALSKKHEVLTKILEEQKRKQETVASGLEHARQSYEKIGKGLTVLNKEQEVHEQKVEDLRKEYQQAEERLDAMTKAGNASADSVKKQEAVTKSLAEQLKQEENALKEVHLAIGKGEKNYQSAGNRVKDWETKLNTAEAQVIKATSAVNKNAAYMREAEQSTDKCAASIDAFGKEVKEAEKVTVEFGTVIKAKIFDTIFDKVKDVARTSTSAMLEMESAQKQFQASTGATTTEMRKYKTVMDELHQNNYGNDMQDIAESMSLVRQYTGELDSSKLKEMTENGIAMRDVFGMDLSETIRGVDSLVDNMGMTSEEAFNLMARGAQRGLDKSGELADNIAEYGQLWGQAGFSAKEMFSIMENGLNSGAYNLDKVNDFVKEFGNSLADGRIEKNLKSFSSNTEVLFKEWKAGKATTKDVFYSVIHDLATATNQQKMLTLASETWSALGEDNAMKVITSLDEVNDAYDDVKDAMEEIKDIKYDTLESRLQTLGKKFQTEVAIPIAERALPKLEKGLDFVIENMGELISLVGGVAAGVGTFKAAGVAVAWYESTVKAATASQTAYALATDGAAASTTILNTVCNANPFVVVASAIAVLGTTVFLYSKYAGEASEESKALAEMNKRVCDSANQVSEETAELIGNYKENESEMQAQTEYAKILGERIEALADKTRRTNEETVVMQEYIAELNQLVPGLNMAYDEQAGKLSMTNEQLTSYLENKQKEIELQASEEYMIELIKKRSELEIESLRLEKEKETFQKETAELQGRRVTAILNGQWDLNKSLKEMTDSQRENSKAIEENEEQRERLDAEMEATQQYLEQHGITMDMVTQSTQANTEAVAANAGAQTTAAESNAAALQAITESYTGMQETVSSVLESQMNMFEKFELGTEISSETLLENMRSQIDGVTNWADNMAVLAERGVNQGILDKLAEMGPEGSNYVQAFANMTDEQLQQASAMWIESMDMKDGVHEKVQGMFEQYTIAVNGGKEKVTALMKSVGVDSVQGLVNGMNESKEQAGAAARDLGNEAIDGTKSALDSHSPSRVFEGIGKDVVAGLTNGIQSSENQAVRAAQELGKNIEDVAKQSLNERQFKSYGEKVAEGVAEGIGNGERRVENAVERMCRTVTDAVDLSENTLYNEGYNVSIGLAMGISAGSSAVINAVAQMCYDAVAEARADLDIHSPSKVFEKIGEYTAEGLGVGYENKMEDVNKIIRDSMEIPSGRSAGNRADRVNNEEMLGIMQEYLPYLQAIAGKEVCMYPSKRKFQKEIAEAANEGMTGLYRREMMR